MTIHYPFLVALLALMLVGSVHAGAFVASPESPKPVVLQSITFDCGSKQLTLDAKADLSRLAKVMRDPASAGQVYRIEGHSEAWPDAAAAQAESLRRAEAVRGYLIEQGVPAERLLVQGFGATKPAVPDDPANRANRRIEITLVTLR